MAKSRTGSTDNSFCDYILDQLGSQPKYVAKRMFGGYGLYAEAAMFGVLCEGRVFLKVDDGSVGAYVSAGMDCFEPYGNGRRMKSYYEVPAVVLESPPEFRLWADRAAKIAAAVKRPQPKRKVVEKTSIKTATIQPTKPRRRHQA